MKGKFCFLVVWAILSVLSKLSMSHSIVNEVPEEYENSRYFIVPSSYDNYYYDDYDEESIKSKRFAKQRKPVKQARIGTSRGGRGSARIGGRGLIG